MGVVLTIVSMGCAPQLPYPPPVPPQNLPQLWDQYELTHQLQELTYNSYTLDAGDKILIRVDGHQPASYEVTVDPQGTITYPRLGTIDVAGLTLSELDSSLGSSLATNLHKPRKVTTSITAYRDQHVYILGEVRVPGAHPLTPFASLLELITQAGGPTPDAGWLALVIKKHNPSQDDVAPAQPPSKGEGNGTSEQASPPPSPAIRIDLDELLIGATAQSLQLESGDTIFIPEAAYFFVYGEVERPGRYRLERGMTAIQAISNAGGYTPYASEKHLKVFRYHVHHERCGGELCLWGFARHVTKEPPKAYRLHLHDRLQPADVLIVSARFGL
jgi:polysaccharide export outer membrane protein